MWALNGAASVLATFIAMCISTEISIRACVLTGATCYALAGILLPKRRESSSAKPPIVTEARVKA